MNARTLGCSVKDDGRPGPCGLDISEHKLSADKTAWLHPVGTDVNGRWTWDEDYCHRVDNACSGRACWVCEPTNENGETA